MYKIPANTLFLGQNLIYVPECHSTNSLLGELIESSGLAEGTVIVTDNQTAGRGQRGNVWLTEKGKNLTFSIYLKPVFLDPKDQFRLNMAVSLGVVNSLSKYSTAEIKLKWPNDIFINNKKIGGILIENQLKGMVLSSSVVGIGLNINQKAFSVTTATSLSNATGMDYDLDNLLQDVLEALEAEYLDLRAGTKTLKERYINSLYRYGESHQFESGTGNFYGDICDVDDNGKLCINTEEGVRSFAFKEVRFLDSF